MAAFNGQLNQNAIQSALFNMIISQDIIGGSIKANYNLVDEAKEEAGLYGDTKLYTDVPVLTPVDWVQDSEDAINVLALNRPGAPKTQKLTIDVFKQVRLTKDAYLSKQAFGTEGAFVSYQSVLESRLNKSKETYLNKTYNTFIGTAKGTNSAGTEVKLDIDTAANQNSAGENIAYAMANLVDEMKDYSTDFTKNGFERAFGDEDIKIIWNNKYVNAVKKIDLPSIFHDDALQASFVGEKLPARYFGDVNAHTTAVTGDRATKDLYLTISGASVYVAAGDLIPAGATITAGDAYTVNDKIICKVFTKLPPVLEAFSVGTDFFNAKNLSTNLYLTFGHSTLETLDSEALVTVYDVAE
jgi:hypothetical protein